MKKKMKRLFAFLLAGMMMFSTLSLTAAAEGEEYLMFLAYGGDAVESNDWGLQYYGDGAASNMGDIVATNAYAKVGDTVTIGLTMPAPAVYTWFTAPVLVAEGATNVDYTIDSVKLDGVEMLDTLDLSVGDNAWWYEGTGDYTAEQAIRLKGGYNEWAAQAMSASPANFTTIEYTITLKEVTTGGAAGAAGATTTPTDMTMFLAFGGDAVDSNDWGLQYYGDGASTNMGDIVATNAVANVGDTVTIGLTMPAPAVYTWFMAPVMVAENVTSVDYTIDSVKLDGVDVLDTIDLSVGEKSWWYEGTGDYTGEQAVRLAGGYNEWGDKFMATAPAGFTTIEYTITINDVQAGGAAGGAKPSTESYQAFIAIGADKEAENDWLLAYSGEETAPEGITAVNGTLKNGETTTISLSFDTPVFYTWYVAPCFVVEDAALISEDSTFDVKVYLDGVEVAADLSAGKACWAEGTGSYAQCIRIAGGYNEWGDKYLAESPKGFTEIKYEITPNILVTEPVEAPQFDFDPNGTYNAYIGIQTANYVFRNAWDDASYGKATDYFNEMGFVDGDWIGMGGTFTDAVITGNGTYTVKVEGFDFSGKTPTDLPMMGDEPSFNLLFFSTDLPVNDAVVISNIVLKMDGKEIVTMDTPFMDPDSKEVQKVLLANMWNNEIEALPYFAVPTKSIEISFDVSGFANDAVVEEQEPVVETPAEPEAPAVTEAPAATAEPVDAPAEEGGAPVGLIAGIAVVVAAAIGGGVVVAKKKKAK